MADSLHINDSPIRPLVSVVMPCHNAMPYVVQAVKSALEQSYGNVELVVVDDGSNDGSTEALARLAHELGHRMRVHRTERLGPYPARNLALRDVRGSLVAFLDADDYWHPDFLQLAFDALRSAGADLAYCGWQNFGEGAQGTEPHVPPAYEAGDPVAEFLRSCPWPIHAALVRREVIDAVGGFSEARYSSMDYDLWLRILGHTRRMVRVPQVMAFYRWHGSGQVSAVKWRQVLDALWAQQAFLRAYPQLLAHLDAARIADLTEGKVLRDAYRALWKRDLASSQRLFRHALRARSFGWRDLPYVAGACLPARLYTQLAALRDRTAGSATHPVSR